MSTELLDISVLPSKARAEIKDFYQFLMQKYSKQLKSKAELDPQIILNNLLPKKVPNFTPLKRDAIYEEQLVCRFKHLALCFY